MQSKIPFYTEIISNSPPPTLLGTTQISDKEIEAILDDQHHSFEFVSVKLKMKMTIKFCNTVFGL